MPRSSRGATRRTAKRKPPLTVEALWAIRRIGTPTLSPDGAWACSAVTRFDMETNLFTADPPANLAFFLGKEPNLDWPGFAGCIFDV